jgi:hypothetical protein
VWNCDSLEAAIVESYSRCARRNFVAKEPSVIEVKNPSRRNELVFYDRVVGRTREQRNPSQPRTCGFKESSAV